MKRLHFTPFLLATEAAVVMRAKLEILALVLGFIGLVGTIATTALPMWKVTAFIGPNLIVMEAQWEGLWMVCIRQADISMQCKVYDSLLILPGDIQAARGLMCVSIILAVLATLLSVFGMRDGDCRGKNVIRLVGGCLFVAASLATLIPVCWSTHSIVRDFYNPMVLESQKREIGQALYVGFATFLVLLVAGVILLSRRKKEDKEYGPYLPVEKYKVEMNTLERTSSSNSYWKNQYV